MVLRHPCTPTPMMTNHLMSMGEAMILQLVGGGDASTIFEIWRDKEMEDWTIIVTTLDGLSCMLGSGKGVVPIEWFNESGLAL